MANESMTFNDKRVRDAAKALEDSMDTRELVKFNLSSSRDEEDLAQMEMDIEVLNVTSLNVKVRRHHRILTCGIQTVSTRGRQSHS